MDKSVLNIPYDLTLNKSNKHKMILMNLSKIAVTLVATVLITELMRFYNFNNQNLIMVYILSVLIASRITSGYAYGILATMLSAFAYDFLITEPRMGFSITIGFPITLCTMLLVTFSTSALTIQMRSQTKLALEREHRVQLLYEINQKLLAARDLKTIIKLTNEYLLGHIRRSVIFYTKDPLLQDAGVFAQSSYEKGGEVSFHSAAERETAHKLYTNPDTADISGQFGRNAYYVPIISKEKVLGLIGVSCAGSPMDQQSLLFINMLVGQVALALELQYLSDEQNKIMMDAEREKMHATLLRAISHDLRTPLTGILGASSTLIEQKDHLASEISDELIIDIKENAQWLIRIVENLLSITKISHDAMKLNKTQEAAEEVIAQCVTIIRKRFPDCYIHIRSPEELMMVPMEATLISQVIINLLENSIKNSHNGSLILFDVKDYGDYAEFSVSDTGRGIPDQLLDNLFEVHSSGKEQSVDSVRGMGIGLSICKTIIYAHGGTITGKNKPDGGAYFSFRLPLRDGDVIG